MAKVRRKATLAQKQAAPAKTTFKCIFCGDDFESKYARKRHQYAQHFTTE